MNKLQLLCLSVSLLSCLSAGAASTTPQVDVLVQSPSATETELQIICLFRSSPKNQFAGALTLTDTALKGLLAEVRKDHRFDGSYGEVLTIDSPPGTLKAKKLMLIGLGDSETFSPARMRLVGKIVYRESSTLGVKHPFFAPTILDGGVKRFTTGQVSEQVITGLLEAYRADVWLASRQASPGPVVEQLTYLAGPEYKQSSQDGIDLALRQAP